MFGLRAERAVSRKSKERPHVIVERDLNLVAWVTKQQ